MNKPYYINRKDSDCIKHDKCFEKYGRNDLLPMWVADMDFATPEFITEALAERIKHPAFGYSYIDFRKQIINWQKKRHQFEIETDWIIPLPSVKTGLNLAVQTFTKPGEVIQIQTPVHSSFFTSVILNHRIVHDSPIGNFDLNHFNKNSKLFFLCNPQNPTGKCWSKSELEQVGEFCLQHNMIIISDEIHSDIIFHPHKHIPIASLGKKISDITITLNSAAKTFNLSGLGQAYAIISNPILRKNFQTIADTIYFPQNILNSIANLVAYEQGESWVNELCLTLQKNRDFLYDKINNETKIKMSKPDATYLAWLNFEDFNIDHKTIESKLINTSKIALSSGEEFRSESFFRLNFATSLENIEESVNRLKMI